MPVDQRFIARVAGVSQKTVSQYLRHPEKVGKQTAALLQQTMDEYGYRSHAAARSMRSKRFQHIICLVVMHVDPKHDTLLYYPRYISGSYFGAMRELSGSQYSSSLEIFSFNHLNGDVLLDPRCLHEISCDAILGILEASEVPRSVDQALAELGMPMLWLNREFCTEGMSTIRIEEESAARALAESLCAAYPNPSDHIAWFGPAEEKEYANHYSVGARLRAIEQTLEKKGRKLVRFHSHVGSFMEGEALPVLRHPQIKAVICYNDGHMHSVATCAMRLGMEVPGHLELTGFFGSRPEIPWKRFVRVPDYELGMQGAAYLLRELQNAGSGTKYLQQVSGELVLADSGSGIR